MRTVRPMKPGQRLIDTVTGRPVEVVSIDDTTVTLHTLDDVWPHPKTGLPWGGSTWILLKTSMNRFVEDEAYADPQLSFW